MPAIGREPVVKSDTLYYLNKGKASTKALLILSRKLARVAFSLMKNQEEYVTKRA